MAEYVGMYRLSRENLQLMKVAQYYSGGLSTALHNMTIANVDPTAGMFLDLDKVVVSTWPDFDVISQFGTSSYGPSPTTPSVTCVTFACNVY